MKRATTAVPGELDAPTCNDRIRRGRRLTVPRGLGLPTTLLRREARDRRLTTPDTSSRTGSFSRVHALRGS